MTGATVNTEKSISFDRVLTARAPGSSIDFGLVLLMQLEIRYRKKVQMENEMKEVKTIVLDNGREYFLVDETIINDVKYYYLANMNDSKDICVRKQEIENGVSYLATLDDIDELLKALEAFRDKRQS